MEIAFIPLLAVNICFIILTWRFKNLWERSLVREARLSKMVEELTAAIARTERQQENAE